MKRLLLSALVCAAGYVTAEPKPIFTSEVVKPGAEPVKISVPLKGANRLFLQVDDAGDGSNSDHAAWLNPRLVGPDGEHKLINAKTFFANSGRGKVQKNKTADNQPLTINGQPATDSFGVHAHSLIAFYDLPEGFESFEAEGALPDGKNDEKSSIRFSLFTEEPMDPGFEWKGQTPYLSVDDFLKTVELPEGYYLEPVLVEPQIKEPVVVVFDANGAMYVAQMWTYMQDIDGSGKYDKISRVSKHVDTNGDGTFDKHTIFADNLLLPRIVLPLDDRVIIGETNTNDLFVYRDIDGDGVADEKKPFYEGGNRGGNLEHQPTGLIWSMDNWLYTTYNGYRLRWRDGKAEKEEGPGNGGQWGLTQDSEGKPWYVNAGGERGPLNFQGPIIYGGLNIGDQFAKDYKVVYPIDVGPPDVQGGNRRFRPEDGTLNHFTATCGAEVYRGDRLPAELKGDLFFAEPVGALIRQTKIKVDDGLTYLSNGTPGSEFIRSSDPNFRPVNMVTGPDGSLYIVDMYRGIIQEGNWVRPGSYLRKVVKQYGLDKNFGRGRIFRLRHKDFELGPKPQMLKQPSAELVAHLSHPNGWWRDTAQKLMIVRGEKSVSPALEKVVASHDNAHARMHALWTLEGLGTLTPDVIKAAASDKDPKVRRAAIRVSESLYKAGDKSVETIIAGLAKDSDPNVVVQSIMTAKLLNLKDWKKEAEATVAASTSKGVQELGKQLMGKGGGGKPKHQPQRSKEELAVLKTGQGIHESLCASCHGKDGKGMALAGAPKGTMMAPPFAGSKTITGHPDMSINVVLHGLSGPIDGKTYPAQMISMKSYDDKWVASVLSYVRTSFGNNASMIKPETVAHVRKAHAEREQPWTIEELRKAVPQYLPNRDKWKLSASHNGKKLKAAIDGNDNSRYDTGAHQEKGMWFQVELPKAVELSGFQMDCTESGNDYPTSCVVEVSNDGKDWGSPLFEGPTHDPVTEITFPPTTGKFMRIKLTDGKRGRYWSIHELNVYGREVK
jgi:mono/diheme cytochrome c family protein